jgi:hypothetical protein
VFVTLSARALNPRLKIIAASLKTSEANAHRWNPTPW